MLGAIAIGFAHDNRNMKALAHWEKIGQHEKSLKTCAKPYAKLMKTCKDAHCS